MHNCVLTISITLCHETSFKALTKLTYHNFSQGQRITSLTWTLLLRHHLSQLSNLRSVQQSCDSTPNGPQLMKMLWLSVKHHFTEKMLMLKDTKRLHITCWPLIFNAEMLLFLTGVHSSDNCCIIIMTIVKFVQWVTCTYFYAWLHLCQGNA